MDTWYYSKCVCVCGVVYNIALMICTSSQQLKVQTRFVVLLYDIALQVLQSRIFVSVVTPRTCLVFLM